MRINNNVMAMNTHRQYSVNNDKMASSAAKLSSGYRINNAGDDAAGLAISEKMRAQIKGLKMASKNSEDAISLVQTAEGALTETQSILQRMRELAVQSSSATNEDTVDRVALQAEFSELIGEIDDIASDTRFNDMSLLDGTFATSNVVAGASTLPGTAGVASVTISGNTAASTYTFADDGTDLTVTDGSGNSVKVAGGSPTVNGAQTINIEEFGITVQLGSSYTAATELDGTVVVQAGAGAAANIQTGANQGQQMGITIDDMDAAALGVSTLSIGTAANAGNAITAVNTAINTVSAQRARLGAYQNRLEHKINNLDTSSENLQAAESRIRDIDMAAEMTTYTQNSILVQAATSMLAQANSAPQNVLKLLQ